MIQEVSDTDIRAEVRSHMARHRIDMQHAQFRATNGIVRMSGLVFHLGGHKQSVALSVIESLERDVIGTPGVRHSFFEFDNWRREETGKWEAVKGEEGELAEQGQHGMKSIPLAELLQVMPRPHASRAA